VKLNDANTSIYRGRGQNLEAKAKVKARATKPRRSPISGGWVEAKAEAKNNYEKVPTND